MKITRRRFLSIAAAGTVVPAAASADVIFHRTGRALGALTSMQIANTTNAVANATFAVVEAELARLERMFSLYDAASEISMLNRDGVLKHPSPEFLEVLSLCGGLRDATSGLFDPTIQPLWAHLAGTAPQGAPRALIGWANIRFDQSEVRFLRKGMQITLNGVAQGYITDRVAALLHQRGLRDVLIDMGEIAAIGQKSRTQKWDVGIATPDARVVARLQMKDRALATSAPSSLILDAQTNTGHILRPPGQEGAIQNELVAISSPSAALADGLSTAGCLMSKATLQTALARYPSTRIEAFL